MLQTRGSHRASSFWGGIFHLLPTKLLQLVMDNINTDYWTASFSLSVFASSRPVGLCAAACSAEPLSVNTQSQAAVNAEAIAVSPTSVVCLFPFSTCTECLLGNDCELLRQWTSSSVFHYIQIFICQCWRTFLWLHVVSPHLLHATSLCMSAAPCCCRDTTTLTNIHSWDWLKLKLRKHHQHPPFWRLPTQGL